MVLLWGVELLLAPRADNISPSSNNRKQDCWRICWPLTSSIAQPETHVIGILLPAATHASRHFPTCGCDAHHELGKYPLPAWMTAITA